MPREVGDPTPWRHLEMRIAGLLLQVRPWHFAVLMSQSDNNLYVQFVMDDEGTLIGECAGAVRQDDDGLRRYGPEQEKLVRALGWPDVTLDDVGWGNHQLRWKRRTPMSPNSYRAQTGRLQISWPDAYDAAGLATDTLRLVFDIESTELVKLDRGRMEGH